MPVALGGDGHRDKGSGRRRRIRSYRCKAIGAAHAVSLHQDFAALADHRLITRRQRRVSLGAQPGGAFFCDAGRLPRHFRRRRAFARAEGKHMQAGKAGIVHQRQAVLEHRFGLGGKPRDQVAAEGRIGAQAAHRVAKSDGIGPAVAALHALEDQVVARLSGQMEMRHQPFLVRDGAHQQRIGLYGIDGRQSQAPQPRHQLQQLGHQHAQRRRTRQVGAIGGEIDPGQDDLVKAVFLQPPRLFHQRAHRH